MLSKNNSSSRNHDSLLRGLITLLFLSSTDLAACPSSEHSAPFWSWANRTRLRLLINGVMCVRFWVGGAFARDCKCFQQPGDHVWSTGAGITSGYELPNMVLGTQVLSTTEHLRVMTSMAIAMSRIITSMEFFLLMMIPKVMQSCF